VKENQRRIAVSRRLRREATDAERILWARLRSGQLHNIKFRRQQCVGPYIVDFISYEKRFVLEIDGGQHNTEQARKKDEARTAWLKQRGYQMLRVWNNDVLRNTDGVLEKIVEALQQVR